MLGSKPIVAGHEPNGLLTPPEIQHQNLRKRLGAYRTEDVDALLERVASGYERVWLERDEARQRLAELEAELARYREIEDMLRETLAEARRTADRVRRDAEREAEATETRARARAEAIVADAQLEHERIRMSVDDLRAMERTIVERIRLALATLAADVERILDGGTDAAASPALGTHESDAAVG